MTRVGPAGPREGAPAVVRLRSFPLHRRPPPAVQASRGPSNFPSNRVGNGNRFFIRAPLPLHEARCSRRRESQSSAAPDLASGTPHHLLAARREPRPDRWHHRPSRCTHEQKHGLGTGPQTTTSSAALASRLGHPFRNQLEPVQPIRRNRVLAVQNIDGVHSATSDPGIASHLISQGIPKNSSHVAPLARAQSQ